MKKIWFLALIFAGIFMFTACDDSSSEEVKDYEGDVAAMIAQSYNTNGNDEMYTIDKAAELSGSSTETEGSFEFHIGIPILFGSGSTDFAYTYSFTDCGEEGCDSMDWTGSHSGDWTWNRFAFSFERSYDLHLAGCTTDTVTINGDGAANVSIDFTAVFYNYERHYEASYSHQFNDVVISDSSDYPLSGTVVFDVDGVRTRTNKKGQATGNFSAHAEITFNGTENPVIVINSDKIFTMNLNTGTVTEE